MSMKGDFDTNTCIKTGDKKDMDSIRLKARAKINLKVLMYWVKGRMGTMMSEWLCRLLEYMTDL